MKTSDEGLRLICSFEGYHRALPNGDCTAYQTPLGGGKFDIPTIGFGVTEGVHLGMVWTRQEAEAALRRELAKHEGFVTQLVTVSIGQNQFDALTSFCYNCGPGNLKKLIKPLNAGNAQGTAKAFDSYVRAQGRVLPGLVSRRTREKSLFLKPVEAPAEPYMPQTVDAPPNIGPKAATAAKATAAGGGIYFYIHQFLSSLSMGDPSVPSGWEDQAYGLLDKAQGHASTIKSLASSGLLGYAAVAIAVYFVVGHYLPGKVGGE